MAKLPEGIERIRIREWENKHENFVQKLEKNASFKLRLPASKDSSAAKYRATTKNFQWLIKHAIDKKIRLRAMGSGWSFSKVAVTEGGIIDTKSLRLSFALSKSMVHPDYLDQGGEPGDLFLAQCGMSILQINSKLEKRTAPRSIKASGASNGQTIAGALSTGTHGAAFGVGAIQDFVVGLHVIVGTDRHVYIERASDPRVSDKFVKWLGAELIRDDDMFNAAVVSFGSFGIIHGVMIETEPLFLLEEHRLDEIPYDTALKLAMNKQDFSQIEPTLPFPVSSPGRELYHFEVLINPHKFKENDKDKGVFLKILYKQPYRSNYDRREPVHDGFTYGDDLLGLVQTVLDSLGPLSDAIVPSLVNTLFPLAYKKVPPETGTVGETFTGTKFRGKVGSAAIGIDIKDSAQVVKEIIRLNDKRAFPGGLSLRYVKGTQASLGFTKFPKTCVLELDGVDSKKTRKFYESVWDRLEELNIPYTLHWGKINFNLNKKRVEDMYGQDTVETWIETRNSLLDEATREVFTNKFIEKCGLNRTLGAIV